MKAKKRFFVIAIPFIIFTGCVSTPRLVGPPGVVGSNYTVAQAPVQLQVENRGPQWSRFVRDYNAERLGHNLRLAEIEYRGAEQARVKELGVEYSPPALVKQSTPPSRGYGSRWYHFFGTPAYYYSPYPYYGTTYYGGGFGVGGFSYRSGLGGGGQCLEGNLFGKRFQQSSPGYRHLWGQGECDW